LERPLCLWIGQAALLILAAAVVMRCVLIRKFGSGSSHSSSVDATLTLLDEHLKTGKITATEYEERVKILEMCWLVQ